ncbi:ABC transporter I family member 10-like protein [Tanacetum coccineum]
MLNMDVNYAKSTHIHTYNDEMPTVEADVAFGLGGFNLTNDETKLRVAKALTAIGMYDYLQVLLYQIYGSSYHILIPYFDPLQTFVGTYFFPERLIFSLGGSAMMWYSLRKDHIVPARPVQTLIRGQKQRVAIASALVEERKVLLLDELTTFFDESLDDRILLLLNSLNAKPQADTLRLIENKLDHLMCMPFSLTAFAIEMELNELMINILAMAKTFVGTETSDGKQIKFQAVLLVAKEVAKHIKHIDCTSRFNVANLPCQYLIILDHIFDISLSLLRPVTSSYTTPIESSYAALSSIWDNVVFGL